MEDLLSQVLDINRLEEGELPLNVNKVSVNNIIRYCVQRFDLQSIKHNIEFALSGFEEETTLYFDSAHLEKIVMNLLSNAIKYSSSGSHIYVDLHESEEWVRLSVKDEGPGIAEEDRAHIFNRYYQGKSSSYCIQPGTGIGLAFVKELVSLHKALIEFRSPSEGGSCFVLGLRKGKAHYNSTQLQSGYSTKRKNIFAENHTGLGGKDNFRALSTAAPKKLPRVQRALKTILVVDDNIELRQFLRTQLQNSYNIIEAENGRVAFELTIRDQPDLIVADVMMPVMDGLALAEKLKSKSESAHIPLILLTAKTSKWDTVEGLQCGADDYLGKPFDSAELAARIAAQLNQKQRIAQSIYAKFRRREEGTEGRKPVAQSQSEDEFKQKLLFLIDKNMGNSEYDLNALASDLHLHWATLNRRVKEYFSCTPIKLLRQRRLEASLKLLQNNEGSISEVAYACGFENLAYFSRSFSQCYSVPPSRFSEIDPELEEIS